MSFNGIAQAEAVRTVGAEFMSVTPTLAAQWIEGRDTYRNLNKKRVQYLADDMSAGRWHTNGESIKFDLDGKLTDGQHRLHAIILSGKSILTLVTWTAETHGVDRGMPRSFANLLQNMGVPNACTVQASAAVLKTWYATGEVPNTRCYQTDEQLLTFLETLDSDRLQESIRRAGTIVKGGMGLAGTWSACLYRFAEIDADNAAMFHHQTVTGANLDTGHPILTLRNRLLTLRAGSVSHRPSPQFYAALTTKAWNAFVEGRKLSVLKFLTGEAFPQIAGGVK